MSYNKEIGMYEGYIYLISNDIHSEQVYIGQTVRDIETRWNEHLYKALDLTDCTKLYCKMRAYGISNFHIQLIEKHECFDKNLLIDTLNKREKYYIDVFDSYKNGLNSTLGGRDLVHSDTREVYQYDIYGNLIDKFDSVQDAADQNDVSESNIIACCKYEHKYCAHSVFRYEYLNQEDAVKTIECIYQIDTNGNIVAKYFSCLLASKSTGINFSNICQCCRGARKSAGGFMWHHYIPNI